mmetsp:Transcript_220/g.340  ORF Transcript_220/g.340 Transcript_220/m.340 type:complete len:319 (-) Transcript_220:182-1138(-)
MASFDNLIESFALECRKLEKNFASIKSLAREKKIVHGSLVQNFLENFMKYEETQAKRLTVMCKKHILKSILLHLEYMSQSAKQNMKIFWVYIMKDEALSKIVGSYICDNPEIMIMLTRGHPSDKVWGDMLRACLKLSPCHYMVLNSPLIWQFFSIASIGDYSASSDGFKTFQAIVAGNKKFQRAAMVRFLKKNFDRFFKNFENLIANDAYHVKRFSLKLLSKILEAREHFGTMVKFVSLESNLKILIENMCDEDEKTQYLSFHVFKFFVANPRRTRQINAILRTSKRALLDRLLRMQRQGERQYGKELPLVIDRLREL